ncbi:MAG: TIGR03915 family putative DNA repair protein [Spirochaetaceae bacterium]|jgi:probable DNA metabolism protein|nr:TIGR03915 family putative DNA repair protein [Spirochaetaceae bacterium]
MRDIIDDESLGELFGIPGLPEHLRSPDPEAPSGQGGLFGDACLPPARLSVPVSLEQIPLEFRRLSLNAYNAAVLAALSELPLGAAIPRFCRKVFSAAENAGGVFAGEEARLAADRVASDRGDEDVRAVLEAAAKVTREIDRLRGLLRFCPDKAGIYTARCAPDHFVLPALAGHFEPRFGDTPWAIIDEKRRLALVRFSGEETRLVNGAEDPAASATSSDRTASAGKPAKDRWEELWRTYHRSVDNEARKNPKLQRQFMPERYWKYLTEMNRDKG